MSDIDLDATFKKIQQNKTVIAKYPNKCLTCEKEIKPGDKVVAKGGLFACIPRPQYCLACGAEKKGPK